MVESCHSHAYYQCSALHNYCGTVCYTACLLKQLGIILVVHVRGISSVPPAHLPAGDRDRGPSEPCLFWETSIHLHQPATSHAEGYMQFTSSERLLSLAVVDEVSMAGYKVESVGVFLQRLTQILLLSILFLSTSSH